MALLEHQYSQARYYGGTYSFTGDDNNTLAEYTITFNYNDIQPDSSDPNLALPGSYKVYIDNVFVSPTYIDATNTSNNNYLIKFDNTTPTSKGWYIAWDATGPNDGQTLLLFLIKMIQTLD